METRRLVGSYGSSQARDDGGWDQVGAMNIKKKGGILDIFLW